MRGGPGPLCCDFFCPYRDETTPNVRPTFPFVTRFVMGLFNVPYTFILSPRISSETDKDPVDSFYQSNTSGGKHTTFSFAVTPLTSPLRSNGWSFYYFVNMFLLLMSRPLTFCCYYGHFFSRVFDHRPESTFQDITSVYSHHLSRSLVITPKATEPIGLGVYVRVWILITPYQLVCVRTLDIRIQYLTRPK